jgi:hypothetical protein
MEMDGAEVLAVRPGHKFSVADLDYALSKQRLVIARVTFPGTNVGHAILIRSVDVAADGRKTVRFFTPSHGFDEIADRCEFTRVWDPYNLLIFRFKRK